MNIFKCSHCGSFGYSEIEHPFICDCNRGTWEPAETETITNTIYERHKQ